MESKTVTTEQGIAMLNQVAAAMSINRSDLPEDRNSMQVTAIATPLFCLEDIINGYPAGAGINLLAKISARLIATVEPLNLNGTVTFEVPDLIPAPTYFKGVCTGGDVRNNRCNLGMFVFRSSATSSLEIHEYSLWRERDKKMAEYLESKDAA
jgi:hypothetical protein